MKTLILFFIILSLNAFAGKKKCYILTIPSEDGRELNVTFSSAKSDLVKAMKKESFISDDSRCDDTFFEYIENPNTAFEIDSLSEKKDESTHITLIYDEDGDNKIKNRRKFLKRLEKVKQNTNLKILQTENNGLLRIEVTK